MEIIKENELENICGGSIDFTSTTINAIINAVKVIEDLGYKFGSAIRRIGEGTLCPLD